MFKEFNVQFEDVEIVGGADNLLENTKVTKVVMRGDNKMSSLDSTFKNCSELDSIEGYINLDKVSDVDEMLKGTPLVKSVELSNINNPNISASESLKDVDNINIGGSSYNRTAIQNVLAGAKWDINNIDYSQGVANSVYTKTESVSNGTELELESTLECRPTGFEIEGDTYNNLVKGGAERTLVPDIVLETVEDTVNEFNVIGDYDIKLTEIEGQTYQNLINGKGEVALVNEVSYDIVGDTVTSFEEDLERDVIVSEVKGQTYQNLVDGKGEVTLIEDFTFETEGDIVNSFDSRVSHDIKLDEIEGQTYQNLLSGATNEILLNDSFSATTTDRSFDSYAMDTEIAEIQGNTVQGYANVITNQMFVNNYNGIKAYSNGTLVNTFTANLNSDGSIQIVSSGGFALANLDFSDTTPLNLKANTKYSVALYNSNNLPFVARFLVKDSDGTYIRDYSSGTCSSCSFTTGSTGITNLFIVASTGKYNLRLVEGDVDLSQYAYDEFDLNHIESVGDLYTDSEGNPILDEDGNEQYKIEVETHGHGANLFKGSDTDIIYNNVTISRDSNGYFVYNTPSHPSYRAYDLTTGESFYSVTGNKPNDTTLKTDKYIIRGEGSYVISYSCIDVGNTNSNLASLCIYYDDGIWTSSGGNWSLTQNQKVTVNCKKGIKRVLLCDWYDGKLRDNLTFSITVVRGAEELPYTKYDESKIHKTTILSPQPLRKLANISDKLYLDNNKGKYCIEKNIDVWSFSKSNFSVNSFLSYVTNGYTYNLLQIKKSIPNLKDTVGDSKKGILKSKDFRYLKGYHVQFNNGTVKANGVDNYFALEGSQYSRFSLTEEFCVKNNITNVASGLTFLQNYTEEIEDFYICTPEIIETKILEPIQSKAYDTKTYISTGEVQASSIAVTNKKTILNPLGLLPNTDYTVQMDANCSDTPITVNLGGTEKVISTTNGEFATKQAVVRTPTTLTNTVVELSGQGNAVSNVMLMEGSINQTPDYFEGVETIGIDNGDGTYRVDVETSNENLLNISKETCNSYPPDGDVWFPKVLKENLKVKPNKKYTVTNITEVIFFDKNGSQIGVPFDVNAGREPRDRGKFTTPKDCYSINFRTYIYGATEDAFFSKQFMLLDYSPFDITTVPYVPYQSSKVSLNIPCQLHKIGNIADKLYWDELKGKYCVEKNVDRITCTNTMSIEENTLPTFEGTINGTITTNAKNNIHSDCYDLIGRTTNNYLNTRVTHSSLWGNLTGFAFQNTLTNIRFRLPINMFDTVAKFKESLAIKPLEFFYKCNTEIIELDTITEITNFIDVSKTPSYSTASTTKTNIDKNSINVANATSTTSRYIQYDITVEQNKEYEFTCSMDVKAGKSRVDITNAEGTAIVSSTSNNLDTEPSLKMTFNSGSNTTLKVNFYSNTSPASSGNVDYLNVKLVDIAQVEFGKGKRVLQTCTPTTYVDVLDSKIQPNKIKLSTDTFKLYPKTLLPSTKYTVKLNSDAVVNVDLAGSKGTVNNGKTVITTKATLENNNALKLSGDGVKASDIVLIEGEINQTPSYIDGIKSVGTFTTSKNVIKPIFTAQNIHIIEGSVWDDVNCFLSDFLDVAEDTNYVWSSLDDIFPATFVFFDIDKTVIGNFQNISSGGSRLTPLGTKYIRVRTNSSDKVNYPMDLSRVPSYKFQLEKGVIKTPYDEYYKGERCILESKSNGSENSWYWNGYYKRGELLYNSSTSQISFNDDLSYSNFFVPVRSNSSYMLRIFGDRLDNTGSPSVFSSVAYLDENKKCIGGHFSFYANSCSLKTPANCKYILCSVQYGNVDISWAYTRGKIMLGSDSSSIYLEPQISTTSFTLPCQLHKIDNVQDKLYWDDIKGHYCIEKCVDKIYPKDYDWWKLDANSDSDGYDTFILESFNTGATYFPTTWGGKIVSTDESYVTLDAIHLRMRYPSSKFNSNVEEFKSYCLSNDIYLLLQKYGSENYEIIDLPELNQKGLLRTYSPKTYVELSNSPLQADSIRLESDIKKYVPLGLTPNTKYTLQFDSVGAGDNTVYANLGGKVTEITTTNDIAKHHKVEITTPATLDNPLLSMSGNGMKISDTMLMEGTVNQTPSYFDGIESVGVDNGDGSYKVDVESRDGNNQQSTISLNLPQQLHKIDNVQDKLYWDDVKGHYCIDSRIDNELNIKDTPQIIDLPNLNVKGNLQTYAPKTYVELIGQNIQPKKIKIETDVVEYSSTGLKGSQEYTVQLEGTGDISVNLGGTTKSISCGDDYEHKVVNVTTPNSISDSILRLGGDRNKVKNVMLFEGNKLQTPDYFDGEKNVGQPVDIDGTTKYRIGIDSIKKGTVNEEFSGESPVIENSKALTKAIKVNEIHGNTVQGYANVVTSKMIVDSLVNSGLDTLAKLNSDGTFTVAVATPIIENITSNENFIQLKPNTTYSNMAYRDNGDRRNFYVILGGASGSAKAVSVFTTDSTGKVLFYPMSMQGGKVLGRLVEGEVDLSQYAYDEFDLNHIESVGDLYTDSEGNPILDVDGNEQYKIEVESCNYLNLLDTNPNSWKLLENDSAKAIIKQPIKVNPNTIYTLYKDYGVWGVVLQCDKDGNIIKQITSNNLAELTFSTPVDCSYILIRNDIVDIQYGIGTPHIRKFRLFKGVEDFGYDGYVENRQQSKTTILSPQPLRRVARRNAVTNQELVNEIVQDRLYYDYSKNKYCIEQNIKHFVTPAYTYTGLLNIQLNLPYSDMRDTYSSDDFIFEGSRVIDWVYRGDLNIVNSSFGISRYRGVNYIRLATTGTFSNEEVSSLLSNKNMYYVTVNPQIIETKILGQVQLDSCEGKTYITTDTNIQPTNISGRYSDDVTYSTDIVIDEPLKGSGSSCDKLYWDKSNKKYRIKKIDNSIIDTTVTTPVRLHQKDSTTIRVDTGDIKPKNLKVEVNEVR